MIIHGDGSDQKLLLEEGIRQTEAFASLTGFDEENIMLSLYAASQSKAKLITKVNKIAFENVINSLNLGRRDLSQAGDRRHHFTVCARYAELHGQQRGDTL